MIFFRLQMLRTRATLAASLVVLNACGGSSGDAEPATLPQQRLIRAVVTVDGVARVADYVLNQKNELLQLTFPPGPDRDLYSQTCSGSFLDSYSCSQTTGVQLTVTRGTSGLPVEMTWTDPRNPQFSAVAVSYRRNWNRSIDGSATLQTLSGSSSFGFGNACLRPFATLQRGLSRLESIASVVTQGIACTMSTIPLPFNAHYTITYGFDGLPMRVTVIDSSSISRSSSRSFDWRYEAGRLSSIVMLKYDSSGAQVGAAIERGWRYDKRGNVIEFRLEAIEYADLAYPVRPCLSPRPPDPRSEEDITYLLLEQMTLVETRTLPGCPAALPWPPY